MKYTTILFLILGNLPAWGLSETALSIATVRVKQSTEVCSNKAVGVGAAEDCYARGLKSADDLLNRTYQQWQSSYGANSDEGEGRARLLKEAQRSWIKYRDAHCAFSTAVAATEYEVERMVKTSCLYDETIRRLTAMNDSARGR